MAKRLASILLLALGTAAAPGVANACSVVMDHEPTAAERRAEARKTLDDSVAVYDGIVVEAATRDRPAKVQVVRTFKGPVVEFFYVADFDSCDIFFGTVGERNRFVLFRGPDVFSTWVDTSNAIEIDRLLGSDRRKDWPYFSPAN